MNGEMYVVQLIMISERARAIATEILGETRQEYQLAKLKDPDIMRPLARSLNCAEDKAFERFALRLRAAFTQRVLPPFTRYHIQLLNDSKSLVLLGKLLDRGPDDVLRYLFDRGAMLATLRKVDPRQARAREEELSPAWLLHDILLPPNANRLEQRYAVGFNEWGEIIASERWLSGGAAQKLRDYASDQNWPADDELRVLAAFLQETEQGWVSRNTEHTQVFDWLALTYLHQYLLVLSDLLREQAIKYAEQAIELPPTPQALRHLQTWLEVYERGAITRAMPYLIPERRPLHMFVSRKNCDVLSPRSDRQPDPRKELLIKNKNIFEKGFLSKKPFGTFEVHCFLAGEQEPRPILRRHGLPLHLYDHLLIVLSKFTGEDLSPEGESIGERLLNTLVIVPDRFLRLLNAGVKQLGPAFVQCLVLSGTLLPLEMNFPGREDLSNEWPYKKLEVRGDMQFLHDSNTIADALREHYKDEHRKLDEVSL